MNIDIGINEKDRAEIAGGLGKLLADTYSLYLKPHNFHLERNWTHVSNFASDV